MALLNEARALLRWLVLSALMMVPLRLVAQQAPVQIPAATPFPVQLGKHVPLKRGEPLTCRLLYPVYAENQLVIPAGSTLHGSVVALKPDRSHRIHSWLWGDFTPYSIPVVHFDQLMLPDGNTRQFESDSASDGAPVLHLSTPASKKPNSLISRQIAAIKEQTTQAISLVTAPGRTDRLVQFLYRQLPYHPQRIETGTMWTVVLAQPLTLKPYEDSVDGKGDPGLPSPVRGEAHPPSPSQLKGSSNDEAAWNLRAYLDQTISSANEKQGNTFEAVVAEPIFNRDHTLAVPQGSVLVGTITRVKPARWFGRAGRLRFDFRELRLPGGGPSRDVQGSLAGADANKSQQLQIDSEGGVESKPQNRVIVPLVLTFLAGRALDEDGNLTGNAAVSSNGFGLIGRVIGIAVGSRELAAGLGFYAAGLSFSARWLVRGQDVVFEKNTRIEVTTVPTHNPLPGTRRPEEHPINP